MSQFVVNSVPGAVATGSQPRDGRDRQTITRSLPLPVLISWPHGHAGLATTLLKQGRVDEALKSVREVLRLKPNYIWAQIELSRHLLKRNEYREAITVLRGRPSLSPSYTVADAYLMLDEALGRMGGPVEERREVWEQILTLDESIPAFRVAQVEVRKRMAEVDR